MSSIMGIYGANTQFYKEAPYSDFLTVENIFEDEPGFLVHLSHPYTLDMFAKASSACLGCWVVQ